MNISPGLAFHLFPLGAESEHMSMEKPLFPANAKFTINARRFPIPPRDFHTNKPTLEAEYRHTDAKTTQNQAKMNSKRMKIA